MMRRVAYMPPGVCTTLPTRCICLPYPPGTPTPPAPGTAARVHLSARTMMRGEAVGLREGESPGWEALGSL